MATSAAITISAALVMIFAGIDKKMLSWKTTKRSCQTCGRVDRYNCACRR
ncbi:MAG TPA: hypothetical protein VG265_16675 [Gaiellaceae bacterium]|nr:hypothetical protein [Gaiellaceae bacterium]